MCGSNFRIIEYNLRSNASIYPKWVSYKIVCLFSSKNRFEQVFFSILQIVRIRSPLNGLFFQISDQYNKILDLMHLYFQNVHEEHQVGLV
jgi:hypothetical protein